MELITFTSITRDPTRVVRVMRLKLNEYYQIGERWYSKDELCWSPINRRSGMKWKDLYKIGISGSRRFTNPDLVGQYLEGYLRRHFDSIEDVVLLFGDAIGVDIAVERYCLRRGIKFLKLPARWLELDKSAGPIRNQYIVDLSNELLAFWDGISPGTKGTIRKAKRRGIPYKVFSVDKLRRILKVEPPVRIKVPKHASNRTAKRMAQWVRDANLKNFFTGE